MKDFNFYAPTRVVFGKQSEEQLPRLLKEAGGKRRCWCITAEAVPSAPDC